MSLFPIFLKLAGRRCLVVGAGNLGESKIQSLLEAGANVHVVALQASHAITELADAGVITLELRSLEVQDLDAMFLVIAATSVTSLNQTIFQEAQARGVLCNAVDDPDQCDFYYGAVVRRGNFQIAISTAGHSPALAQRLRRQLEIQFGPEYGEWLEQLGSVRKQLFASPIDPEVRRNLLHEIASQQAFDELHSLGAKGQESN
jgi:precorrin-2 dehydrogenase / sirohydrochlorin ferrochelatase